MQAVAGRKGGTECWREAEGWNGCDTRVKETPVRKARLTRTISQKDEWNADQMNEYGGSGRN